MKDLAVPFNPYDFFGYLASGLAVVIGMKLVLGFPVAPGRDLKVVEIAAGPIFAMWPPSEEGPMAHQQRGGAALDRSRSAEDAQPASPRYPWPDLSGIHAYLIEDNEDTRTMVSDTLRYCGAMVTVDQSADAALARVGEFVPTVFICDLSMPGLDGLSFMRRMRSLPAERGGRIPAIAITAYYEDFAAAAALEVGFNAYMTKPIRLEALCQLVKELAS